MSNTSRATFILPLVLLFLLPFLLPLPARASAFLKPANNLGLVGYWTFDEGMGSTAADHSGNGNTGTLTTTGSNLPAWSAGYHGKALSFDGSTEYVNAGDNASLRPANITTCAWFKLSTGSLSYSTILAKAFNGPTWSSPYVAYLMRIDSIGAIEFDVGNGATFTNDVETYSLSANKWYFACMT